MNVPKANKARTKKSGLHLPATATILPIYKGLLLLLLAACVAARNQVFAHPSPLRRAALIAGVPGRSFLEPSAAASSRLSGSIATAAAFASPPHLLSANSDYGRRYGRRRFRTGAKNGRRRTGGGALVNMVAADIDGKAIAATIRSEIKDAVAELKSSSDATPGLAVILVGSRRDSQTYVRMKKKACEECGIASFGFDYPEDVDPSELLAKISELNADPAVHGILVQLPLPSHVDENAVLNAIDPAKDVDGLHPLNTASLCSTATHVGSTRVDWAYFGSVPFHVACTPQGCVELLDRSGVELRGKRAVVVGRSNLVGLPVAMLLMHRDATVTIVHSKTVDAPSVVSEADVVVAAVGRARMVKGDWIKEGAVVIDVGINSVDDPEAKRGYRLVGDVDYEAAKERASMITPVPGGVGPMTIAILLRNTLNSCRRTLENK